MSKESVQYFVSLEVGSSKVAMAMGSRAGDKTELIALTQVPHKGMHQGQIVDTREIILALRKAKNELEAITQQVITTVIASVADQSIESLHAKGVLSVKKSVSVKEIAEIQTVAEELVPLRSDRVILHHLPIFYKIGSQKFPEAPLGQKTTSLELQSLLIVGSKKIQQTVRDCAQQAELQISEFVAAPIAAAEAILTQEDKDKGVALVDIGSAMTHILAYKAGKVALCHVLQIGGAHFTNDLAVGLRTPQLSAEKIKKNHGAALVDLVSDEETVEVDSLKNEPSQRLPAKSICEILEARAEETLTLLLRKLNDEDLLSHLKAGLVLTGGGSQLPGLPELGEFTFDVVMRRGGATNLLSANPQAQGPAFSVVVGLLQCAQQHYGQQTSDFSLKTLSGSFNKIKNFFENIL